MRPINIIGAEIANVLRATGNTTTSGTTVPGNYSYTGIPQVSIGLFNIEDFMNRASTVSTNSNQSAIDNIAAVSLDGIFAPYTTSFSHTTLPFRTRPTDSGSPNSLTLNPFNPNNSLGSSGNQTISSGQSWRSSGHNISIAMVGNTGDFGASGRYPSGNNAPVDYYFEKDYYARGAVEISGVRSVGLKSPMWLSGWGYDINGNPVPANTGDSTKFHPRAFYDPSTWKSGPVDLRWDESRGVWRSPDGSGGGGGGTTCGCSIRYSVGSVTGCSVFPQMATSYTFSVNISGVPRRFDLIYATGMGSGCTWISDEVIIASGCGSGGSGISSLMATMTISSRMECGIEYGCSKIVIETVQSGCG